MDFIHYELFFLCFPWLLTEQYNVIGLTLAWLNNLVFNLSLGNEPDRKPPVTKVYILGNSREEIKEIE